MEETALTVLLATQDQKARQALWGQQVQRGQLARPVLKAKLALWVKWVLKAHEATVDQLECRVDQVQREPREMKVSACLARMVRLAGGERMGSRGPVVVLETWAGSEVMETTARMARKAKTDVMEKMAQMVQRVHLESKVNRAILVMKSKANCKFI